MTRSLRPAVVAGAIGLALMVAACAGQAAAPPPTRTPAPTFTATPLVEPAAPDPNAVATAQALQAQQPQAQAPAPAPGGEAGAVTTGQTDQGSQPLSTSVFSDTAAAPPPVEPPPTETPVPANAQLTLSQVANVRGGPGTTYNVIGAANPGQTFPITGKSPDGQWWQVTYNGQSGWLFGQLVSAQNTEGVAVAQNIPAAPVAPPVAVAPPPVEEPAPAPAPEEPPPAPEPPPPPADNFPYGLLDTARCDPNPGQTYFQGFTRDANNNLINGVCIHVYFYEPRTTKCSGCDGVGDGIWGFSPFNGPAPRGTEVEIYVVECPPNGVPQGGMGENFGNVTPQSPKWSRTINESEQCTGITFYKK